MSGLTHWWKVLQSFCCSVTNSCLTLYPWMAAQQASLSFTLSLSLLMLMSIELVMPSNKLILSSPSPPALNLSQRQGLFQWASSSHQVAKVLELQFHHQPFQWIFRFVQLLSCVWLFVTPWTAACQASLSLTISRSLPKFMSIELVMLSNIRVDFL